MQNDTSKYTNHTKKEIAEYVEKIKKIIKLGRFVVCTTEKNEKNIAFLQEYNLSSYKIKEMLLELKAKDFCYSVDNYNCPEERLYIFCREYELNNCGIIEKVNVYIKIAIKQNDFIVIVSFNKPEKDIKKLFL